MFPRQPSQPTTRVPTSRDSSQASKSTDPGWPINAATASAVSSVTDTALRDVSHSASTAGAADKQADIEARDAEAGAAPGSAAIKSAPQRPPPDRDPSRSA